MEIENKAGAEDGAAVGCIALLGRAIDRMNARREWLLERKAHAMECSDTLQAAGWGIRAAGVADAIDIIEALKSERPNDELCSASDASASAIGSLSWSNNKTL